MSSGAGAGSIGRILPCTDFGAPEYARILRCARSRRFGVSSDTRTSVFWCRRVSVDTRKRAISASRSIGGYSGAPISVSRSIGGYSGGLGPGARGRARVLRGASCSRNHPARRACTGSCRDRVDTDASDTASRDDACESAPDGIRDLPRGATASRGLRRERRSVRARRLAGARRGVRGAARTVRRIRGDRGAER
jgi:hypothetical protein